MLQAHPRSIVQRTQAGGLMFTETVFEPYTVLGRHTHANAYISFVRAGSYTERLGPITRVCESSTLLFHAPGETHENRFHAEPVRLLRIEAFASDLLRAHVGAAAGGPVRSVQPCFLCQRMLRELDRPDDLTSLVLQGLAYELVAELTRSSRRLARRGPAWLKRIDELLVESFAEPPSLSELADAVDVHPVHLARTFRRYRRQTVGERLRDLRLQHAPRVRIRRARARPCS